MHKQVDLLAFTETPSIKFYEEFHQFIKYWSYTLHATKTAIGKLYLAIEPYLRQKGLMSGKSFRIEEHLKTQSGEENSSSGRFNPVGCLQQSGCLGSYPP